MYIIEAIGDKYVNFQGSTSDIETLSATSAFLEENVHPSVTGCDDGVNYTLTSPRWSGGTARGGFSALIQVPVVEDISDGWAIKIKFSEPLKQFSLVSVFKTITYQSV